MWMAMAAAAYAAAIQNQRALQAATGVVEYCKGKSMPELPGKCPCCGSYTFTRLRGIKVCAYCRSEQ